MLKNGVLARLLAERPESAIPDGAQHRRAGHRRRSGGAGFGHQSGRGVYGGGDHPLPGRSRRRAGRVDGRLRLLEGLALPHEEIEFRLSYYNSNTSWLHIDQLLAAFGLSRADLGDAAKVTDAIRTMAARMPTYITLKDVKKRWGKGQEDVFPVAQFEKLWGDMTALPELACRFIAVPRRRGQNLKDPAQLDGWLRDGSAAYVESLCDWG